MKLLIIQKYDLQIIITCCHSIIIVIIIIIIIIIIILIIIVIIKEYSEGICSNRYKCIHLTYPFCVIAIVKGKISIQNVLRFG